MIALKHILLPTDFSDTAAVALKYARALAETFNAALHVLENPLLGWKPPRRVAAVPVIRANMEHDAGVQMAKLLTDAERQQLRAQTVTT